MGLWGRDPVLARGRDPVNGLLGRGRAVACRGAVTSRPTGSRRHGPMALRVTESLWTRHRVMDPRPALGPRREEREEREERERVRACRA